MMINQRLLYMSFALLFKATLLLAQLPDIKEPTITPSQISIYISLTGNDQNDGSPNSPVQSYQKAMELIPFESQNDVNGEIVFLEGDYYPTAGLQQNINNSQNGNFRKNISIRGEGEVNIFGDNTMAGSHLVVLRGSGISIKNINLFNAKGIGILISDPSQAGILNNQSQINNVLIEEVIVDNTISHGIITQLVSKIKFEKIIVKNACQENTDINGNCQWGSALRTAFCDNIIVRDCEVYHNKGEGINIGTSKHALVESNESYDNFAANIYCIRTNNAIFRNNLIFNKDSTYWRNCQADNGGVPQIRKPTPGFSIANEVNYDDFFNNNCEAERIFLDGVFPNKIADSIFFYNNIMILAPLIITDDSRGNCIFPEFSHANNLSNIFIENNTFIGDISADHNYLNRSPIISMSFNPLYFWGCLFDINGMGKYKAENIVFKNNIISLENSWNGEDINSGFILYGGRPCNGGSLADYFSTSGNSWHHAPSQINDHYAASYIPNFLYGSNNNTDDEMLTTYDPLESINILIPDKNANNNHFYKEANYSSYILKDFLGNDRDKNNTQLSNVGALEARQLISVNELEKENEFNLFPNPTNNNIHLVAINSWNSSTKIEVFNSCGIKLKINISTKDKNNKILELNTFATGIYTIRISHNNTTYFYKVAKIN